MLFEMNVIHPDGETGVDEDSYSELMKTLKVEYSDVCGSSYESRDSLCDNVNAKWFVTAKRNDAMFTLDSVKKAVPSVDNDVLCRSFLNEKQYNVVYFIDPTNPHEWFGFASYSYDEKAETTYHLDVTLELIYIKPIYRKENLGYVTAYELGRLISEGVVFYGDKITKDTTKVYLSSYSQGCNSQGASCLNRFFDGLLMHFSDLEILDENDDFYTIPVEIELVDEY
jgi:hypothetical protein